MYGMELLDSRNNITLNSKLCLNEKKGSAPFYNFKSLSKMHFAREIKCFEQRRIQDTTNGRFVGIVPKNIVNNTLQTLANAGKTLCKRIL